MSGRGGCAIISQSFTTEQGVECPQAGHCIQMHPNSPAHQIWFSNFCATTQLWPKSLPLCSVQLAGGRGEQEQHGKRGRGRGRREQYRERQEHVEKLVTDDGQGEEIP